MIIVGFYKYCSSNEHVSSPIIHIIGLLRRCRDIIRAIDVYLSGDKNIS